MLKKLLTFALGLLLATGVGAQVTVNESEVAFWTGTGTNSTVVAIGWDDDGAGYTPTVVVWGVRWNGTITLLDALDTIATYDERFTYTVSGTMLGTVSYIDSDEGISLTPSMMYNCNSYGGAYGSTSLSSTWLRISESTCYDYNFSTVNNIIYANDPNAVVSCPKVQSVSVTGLTASTATVNMVDTNDVNNYTVKLYAGEELADSAVIASQSITYSTLTANTGYTVQVFSNCEDGTQSASRNASFRTPCVMIPTADLPWTEDFQSGTGSSYSTSAAFFSNYVFCWDLINPYSGSDPYINSSSSVNVSGGQCLYVSSRPTSPTILVLPPFEEAAAGLRLQFDVLSTYRHGFEAGVITDVSDISTFTPIATCLPDGNGWTHFEVTFAGITSGRLALRSNDNGPAYLDNVTVDELPSCVKPSRVDVSDIAVESAVLTISDPNNTNHYMVRYTEEDSVEVFSNTVTLTNLMPNTLYRARVRTLCSDSTTGFTERAFRTGCGSIAIPYHEDFSQFVDVANGYGYAVADSTLPCWTFHKGRGLDRLELFPPSQGSSYGYGEDGYTMRIYGNYSDSRDIVVLPEFEQSINTLEMSFMARPSETGSFGGVLQIGYVTDASDSSTFVAVANYPCAQFANGYDLCTSTFLNAPSNARIAVRYLPTGGSAKSWYIDDIDVHDMPACVRAQGISVDNIGTESFTLHIADPTVVNHYRYYLSTENVVDSADIYDTVAVVTGLTASTDYQLQVVSICDDGSLTLPHTISVSTLCAPVTVIPFVENFEDWTATQSEGMNRCWNRLYMNSYNSLVSNNYPYCASGSGNAYNGFKSLKMYSKGTSNAIKEYSVAYLPEFQANVTGLKVRFFYKYGGSTTNINKVRIAVGVSESVTDTTTFTRLATLTPSEIGWNEFEVELSAYTGSGNRITIMQASTGTTSITSYIDSLVVDTISSCNRPASVAVTEVSAHGATIIWTDPSEAGSYIVRWSDGANTDSVTVTDATTYELTGLTPSTNYTVDVSSICWGAPTAARSTSFATSCAPMPLPWEMNFDNITNMNQLSSCWNRYSGLYDDATNSATLTSTTSGWTRSTTAFDGSSHMKVNLYGTNCKYWLVTPEIDLTENAELTFDYMLTKYNVTDAPETGAGLEDDRFIVLATTDNGTTWTPVAQWGNDTVNRDDYYLPSVTNTPSQAAVSLSDFTGQSVRLAFYGESTVGGTDNDFRIDNIQVSAQGGVVPEPPAPVDSITNADILFWVGHGLDSAIVIINWVDTLDLPTTYAWGLAFDDEEGVVVSEVFDSLSAYDPRFYHSFSSYMGTIHHLSMVRFVDENDTLYTITAGMDEYNCVKLNGVGIEGSDFEDEWISAGALIEVSTNCDFNYDTIIPVNPPDIPEPVRDTVDATIAFEDILYWVGSGSDSAAFIVSYAQPDTSFAWGYLFDGSTTAQSMVEAIAAADPRLWITGSPSAGGDIRFVTEEGDTLALSPVDPDRGYNFWWTNHNGLSAGNGSATILHNGDVFKYGDLNSAVDWDYQNGFYLQEAWPKIPTPVSVPQIVGIYNVMSVIESIMPNPTTDYVNVSVSRTVEAVLYDLSGRQVAKYTLSEGNNKIDLTAFQSGVYMLRAAGVVHKVIKR